MSVTFFSENRAIY